MKTWTTAEVDAFIASHPGEVESALAAIQLDLLQRLTLDVISANAPQAGQTVAELLIDQLDKLQRLDRFVEALRARGVPLGVQPPDVVDPRVDATRFGKFALRADRFRCLVLVDHQPVGSGCLVGPSLVLTAWHVIAAKAPDQPDPTAAQIEIQLSDGTKHPARVPPAYFSRCGDAEFGGVAPRSDSDVADRKDVAVLTMDRPVAAHLDFAPVPAAPPGPYEPSLVFLFDLPGGTNVGMGIGKTSKMRGVTVRWSHDVPTQPGSSGGAAFGATMELLGVHQAKWGDRGRLVPTWVFLDDMRALVESDRAPMSLWTLDKTPDGQLVVGRDAFFTGVRAAGREVTRIRGVRIKRTDPAAAGLGFSYELLVQLLTRKGPGHRPVRITLDEQVPDLEEDIRRRLAAAGIDVIEPAAPTGVEIGQAALEAVMKDRSRLLAAAIDSAAHRREEVVWLFFDPPAVDLPVPARLFFEGFVAAALIRHRIRLIIAGFELAPLAGEEFAAPADADGEGAPGFLVEYMGGFTVQNVRRLLSEASKDLLGEEDPAVDTIANTAVQGLQPFNGSYRDEALPTVIEAIRPTIRFWLSRAAVA